MREKTRRLILRIHGGLMIALGFFNGAGATYGWQTGEGPMGFLREQPLGHVGLLQAYLLIAVVGTALWVGTSSGEGLRKWHVVGALAHCAVLPVYALHWSKFASYSPGGGETRVVVLFHLLMVTIEGISFSRPTRAP
jgi:hypothetical protein